MQTLLDDLGNVDSMYYSIYETAKNSAGSAMNENEKYMQSLQARINQVRSEFEQLAVKVGEAFLSEGIVSFTSVLGKLFESLVKVVDSFGALPLLLTSVGAAILLVNNRFRLLFANIATGRTSVATLSQAFLATATSANIAAISTNALKVAFRGLGASLVVLAPLMAVGYALEFVIGKMTESRERSEELKRGMKEMTESFSLAENDIKSLASSIKDMEEQLSKGAVPDDKLSEFTSELIEKRNELANLMPSLKKGEDEYGNAILYSNSMVETQISLSERQLELQKQIDDAKAKKEEIENIKTLELEYQKLNKQIESQVALLQNRAIHAGQNKFLLGEQVLDDFKIQDLDDAVSKLDELKVKRQEAMQDGDKSLVKRLDDEIDNFTGILYNAQLMQMEQEAIKQQIVSGSQQALLEILENNNAIDESTQTMISNIAELLATSELSTEEVKTLIDEIAFSLQNDDAFQVAIQSYQNAMTQLESAREKFNSGQISEEAYMGQVKTVSKEMDVIISKIDEMAKRRKIDIDSSAYKEFIQELNILGNGMEDIVQKAKQISESTGIPFAQAFAQAQAASESVDSLTDSLENVNSVLGAIRDNNSDVLTDVLLETDRLVQSLYEAEEALKSYSAEELANLEAKRKRIATMEQEGAVTEYLTLAEQLMAEEVDNSNVAYQQLLETYDYLFTAEQLSVMSKEEIMKAINAEIISVDELNIAIQALKDGKLSADDAMAVKGAQRATQAIHNINEEIKSLKLLIAGYEEAARVSVNAAVAAGESAAAIGKARGENSEEYKIALNAAYELGNKAIENTRLLNNTKNTIKTYEAQIQELTSSAQQYSGAVKNIADAHRQTYSTIGKGREFDSAEAMRKANEALDKNTKGTKGNTAAKKQNAKATKEGAKAEELAAFWANKHKETIEELTLALKAQELATKKLPKHSQEYKKGLQEQLKLEKLKLEIMKAQEISLKQQIASGNIIKSGVQTQSQAQAQAKGTTNKGMVFDSTRKLSGWGGTNTSGFGKRWGRDHEGVDIAVPVGTRLDSNVFGKVIHAGKGEGAWSGFGNYVAIQAANGIVHYYAHLQDVAVKKGDSVLIGQNIGRTGNTGRSTGPHLHYEQRMGHGGKPINPTTARDIAQGLVKTYKYGSTAQAQPQVKQPVASGGSIESQIWSFLKSKGLSDNAVAGIMGNMQAESNYNPKAVNSIGASGLVQWLGSRKTNLMKFSQNKGTNWQDTQTQLEFLWKELNSTEKSTLASLQKGDNLSAQQHAVNFEKLFERSGGALMQRRQSSAVEALNKFKGTGFVSSGFVDKDVASNIQDVNSAYSDLLGLQGNVIDQNEKIRELEEAILQVYLDAIEVKRQEHDQTIAYENEKIKALDNTSERYAKTLAIQIRSLEGKQKWNKEEMEYIDFLIKNNKLSADRLYELKNRYKDLQIEMLAANNELKEFNSLLIEVDMRRYEENIRRISNEFEYLSTLRGLEEQGSKTYNDLTAQMITLTQKQAEEISKQVESLKELSSSKDISIEKMKEYNQKIHDLNKQYWQLQGTIKDLQKSEEEFIKSSQEKIVNNLIEAYKQYLGEKRDMHMKSLDEERNREDERHKKVMDNYRDEMDLYQKAIDMKIREIDREDSQKSYEEQMKELGTEKGKITTKINLLAGDDSLEGKQKRKKLQLELDKINKDIEKLAYNREIEMAKQSLNDKLEIKREEISKKEEEENRHHDETIKRIEREKEYWDKHYTDLLNDERKFAQLREQLMQGHFDALSSEFQEYIKEMEDTMPSLEDTLDGTMEAVGTSIRQNIIDNLKEALKLMTEFQTSQSVGGGTSTGGTGTGGGVETESKKPASEGDFWVLAGKYMTDEIYQYATTDVRRKSIQDKAHDHASTGRQMGSEIPKNLGFEDALATMSVEDQQRFADFIIKNSDSLVMTGEYQDLYKKMAWQILNKTAGFDTGGYTGKFSGGKLATLHGEELILNRKDTTTFANVSQTLSRMQGLIDSVSRGIMGDKSSVNNSVHVDMVVEKMIASDEDEARNYADVMSQQTINSMTRKGWRP